VGGSLARADGRPGIRRPALTLPRQGAPRPLGLLPDGLALLCTGGHAAGAATLQRAAKVLTSIPIEDVLRWGWTAACATVFVWDFEGMDRSEEHTSELQSLTNLVCRLLLEKKKHSISLSPHATFEADAPLGCDHER